MSLRLTPRLPLDTFIYYRRLSVGVKLMQSVFGPIPKIARRKRPSREFTLDVWGDTCY